MERKKSIHVWLYTILIVGIIAAVIWGATATKNAKALAVTTENQYNRAFHELVGYVDDIDTLLSKTQLTKSPAQLAKLSSDIFMVHHAATLKSLLANRSIFVDMSVEMQARTIYQILHIFRCNRMLADLTALQGAKSAGTVLMSKKISLNDKIMIINQSPTGLFENSVDLLTV